MNKHGFTLIELLIAAALAAVLTLFATQTFRGVKADIEFENAKHQARVIAAAVARFKVEYGGTLSGELESGVIPAAQTCTSNSGGVLARLVNCNFLEGNRAYVPQGCSMTLAATGKITLTCGEHTEEVTAE